MIRFAVPFAALLLSTAAHAQTAPAPASAPTAAAVDVHALSNDERAMRSHVMFLAADAMQGREAGTDAYDVAAEYVAAQFYAQGLKPAGTDGSYLQQVPLIAFKAAGEGSFALGRGGKVTELQFGVDYIPSATPQPDVTKHGEVVFVGHGIVAPEMKRDDYAGVDVKGKFVALFSGAPASFNGEVRAHFGSVANKAAYAASRGAIGVIVLESPQSARVRPFARLAETYDSTRMSWIRPDGTGFDIAGNAPVVGTLSSTGAEKLFAGARTGWNTVRKQAEAEGATFKAFELPSLLTMSIQSTSEKVESPNVAGMIEGSDPALRDEVIVLTAHLDHVGIGRPNASGDTIYNGAMDNAVGIAALIENARRFKEQGVRPKRSILFLAVTAEEKGLVGADYFARNPTVRREQMVANVNLDMPIITFKFEDMVAFGAERSTLGPITKAAVEAIGVTLSPDPMPEQGFFVRSDHYRFVQQGVPSVFLWPGTKGPGKAAFDHFLSTHYHQASDELDQQPNIDWASGVRFIEANFAITKAIADAPERPRWNKGDFFGTLYNGHGAK
jgi:Zn-dependent M28 family amino/carboxypeptidase